jgi:uncharacterized hydrophobic protein (TIGR00271 family)
MKLTSFASMVEIEETRDSLLSASEFTWDYVVMNVLAAILATYGLFANSSAVIIGSMIIAMLLGPISSLALGIIDSNFKLIAKSIMTLFVGILIVCITAGLCSLVTFRLPVTDEIMSRTAPNFIDLIIALVGGIAGAYSLVHKRLAIAFVGVAIATALVPPLCSATILLVKGQYVLAEGAFLLTFTNIVGIQFGYSTVLWLKGISSKILPLNKSIIYFIRTNLIGLCIIAGLGALLTFNLASVAKKLIFENITRNLLTEKVNETPGNFLSEVRYNKENGKLVIRAVVTGTELPNSTQVELMENKIPANYLGIPNELRIRFLKTEVITKEGRIKSQKKE